MKRKMIAVLFLVGVCLGGLAVEGVSQPPAPPASPFGAPAPQTPAPVPTVSPVMPPSATGSPPLAAVQSVQQERSFEQLVEALKGVRTQQKALQAQEADILAKMEEKIVQKQKDLSKAEEVLQQMRGKPFIPSVRRMDFDKDTPDRDHLKDKKLSEKK